MAKTKAEHQRLFRKREREGKARRRELLDDISPYVRERLAQDMKWVFEPTDRGTHMIHWDMSQASYSFLTAYAQAKDMTLYDLMGEINQAILERALKAERARSRRN